MKKIASLFALAVMLLGVNSLNVRAYEDISNSQTVFNFTTGQYEEVQPRMMTCYKCGRRLETIVREKPTNEIYKPCIHGHPGYQDVYHEISRVTEGHCFYCGTYVELSSVYLRTEFVRCDWDI